MKLIKTTKKGLTYYEAVFKYYSVYAFTITDIMIEIENHGYLVVKQFFKFNLN